MGSGPYMIKNYISGQSILLSPNPYFTPVPGIPGYNHTANDTVYIQWEKDADTALLIAESGQTDLVYTTGLPTSDFPILMKLQSEGKLKITTFPSVLINFYNFNFDVNTSMLSTLGSGYHIPQYYFANLDVRRAFAYAFNYTNFIENILGNARYGLDFGFQYAQGLAPLGMPGYLNTTQLQQRGAVVPTYNLSIAKQYLEESGLYNTSINIPIIVFAADSVNYAGAGMWASALHSIDPNIQATPLYMEIPVYIGYSVPNENPMPISFTNVGPDYLFTSDYAAPMYGVNGYFGEPEGWTPQMLNSSGQPTQANEDAQMNQIITDAMSTTNLTLALKYYDQAMLIAVNLTFDVYTCQSTELYVYSTAIHGSSYEGNALDVGFTYFIYLSKS
jgi:ABC-type transport system substrate-binding protein